MKRLPFALQLAAIGTVVFVLAGWVGQTGSPSREPIPPTAVGVLPPPPEMLVIEGKGTSQAGRALELAKSQLPFHPLLPTHLPKGGYLPSLVEARVLADGRAVLAVVYSATNNAEYQIFEMNAANDKAVIARVVTEDSVSLAGENWRYLLLAWPQPDGTRQLEHFIERAFSGLSPYTSASLRSTTGDLDAEKSELIASITSLQ